MPDITNQQSAGGHALLVHFTWGVNNSKAYTNWSEPITFGGFTYESEPRMDVESGKQTGGVHDEPWMLTMPATLTPLAQLARPSVYATVTCGIAEIDPTATTQEVTYLWEGQITLVTLNVKDKPGCVRAVIAGRRVAIQYPLGIESKTACSRVFGDKWCGVNLATIQQSAAITVVAGKLISAPSLTVPSGRPANYWSYGKVIVDGLAIGIVDGSGGAAALKLFQLPPPEWVGAIGVFTPGCDKSFGSPLGCTGWSNTARHFGIGAVKPASSPNLTPR